jgi:hypothetical protein
MQTVHRSSLALLLTIMLLAFGPHQALAHDATPRLASGWRASAQVSPTSSALTDLTMEVSLSEMFVSWRTDPTLVAQTEAGPVTVPSSQATWSSSDSTVATVDGAGRVVARSAGTVTITAVVEGQRASKSLTVKAPLHTPTIEQFSPSSFLATPAPGSLYQMPVVIILFLPTQDGVTLDWSVAPLYTPAPNPLDRLKQAIIADATRTKFTLEEGSRFRGYQDPLAPPSLGYRIVDLITIYEPTPQGKAGRTLRGDVIYRPDYLAIFDRINGQRYVEDIGVKEFWIYDHILDSGLPMYDPALHKPEHFRESPESNMASALSGDISNSWRDPTDLPIYASTYVVYSHYYGRVGGGSGHIHGHQLEAMLSYVNQRQEGNTELFWNRFVGLGQTGRSGWTHAPPNTTVEYDYRGNYTAVASDIQDWTPDHSGQRLPVSDHTWGRHPYAWPDGTAPLSTLDADEAHWYVFWMQSMPGWNNAIPYGERQMSNWWRFVGDWDGSLQANVGLSTSAPVPNLLRNPDFEQDANRDNRPDGWNRRPAFRRSSDVTYNGGFAGQLTAHNNANLTLRQTIGEIRSGTRYTFRGYINIPASSDAPALRGIEARGDTAGFSLDLRWLDARGKVLGTRVLKRYADDTGGRWDRVLASEMAPAGAVQAQLVMRVRSMKATIYVDAFTFHRSVDQEASDEAAEAVDTSVDVTGVERE